MGLRVLIGNSRGWSNSATVRVALDECLRSVGTPDRPHMQVVYGHDMNGADRVVQSWAWRAHRLTPEVVRRPIRMPADWNGPCRPECRVGHRRVHHGGHTSCPSAAYYRDAAMIAGGADLALVFIHQGDRPALRFFDKCQTAGIHVVRFTE